MAVSLAQPNTLKCKYMRTAGLKANKKIERQKEREGIGQNNICSMLI